MTPSNQLGAMMLTDEQKMRREQLNLIAVCKPDLLLAHIEEDTNYDAKLLARVFELAKERAVALLSASKPAAINTLFEVLMQQNIVTSEESYLALKCVGVPPTEDEFVRAVQRTIDAAGHSQCCDTAAYCSSVRRCTAKDAAAPAQSAEAFPYQKTFDAIAAATSVSAGRVAISVIKFREAFGAAAQPTQPAKAGEAVEFPCYLCQGHVDVHRADGEYLGKCPICSQQAVERSANEPVAIVERQGYQICNTLNWSVDFYSLPIGTKLYAEQPVQAGNAVAWRVEHRPGRYMFVEHEENLKLHAGANIVPLFRAFHSVDSNLNSALDRLESMVTWEPRLLAGADAIDRLEHVNRLLYELLNPHPESAVVLDGERAWDGDSRESRAAFRNYDTIAEPVSRKTPWQIWRDACAWQARAASPQAEATQARTHTTQPGESVMGIALRECGNEAEWRHILACNPKFADMLPHEYFPVGTVLALPPAAAQPATGDQS